MNESLCNEAFSSITDENALYYFPFKLYELSSVGKVDLKIVAFTDFAGGYARHGRELVEYLNNSGMFNVKLEKLKSNIDIDPFTYGQFKHLQKTEIDENNFIEIVIGAPGQLKRLKDSKAKYKIGYTMAETDRVDRKFRKMCRWCDELFLPTKLDLVRFSKVRDEYNIELTYMPLWVNCPRYKKKLEKAQLVNVPYNNFIFMFNGTWNKRKGVHEIIESFLKEFSSKEPVSLVMLAKYTTKPFNDIKRNRKKEHKNKWNMKWEYDYILEETGLDKKKDKPHICILDVPIDEAILQNFLINAHVCVAASRGESTWLPGLEFGALGITCIQTAWGGHLDYLNSRNSYLTSFEKLENCDDELYHGVSDYYTKNSQMVCPCVQAIRHNMRKAFKDKAIIKRIGGSLRRTIRENYGIENLENVKYRLIKIAENNLGEDRNGRI